jgi:putative FmdB family regulatory protein
MPTYEYECRSCGADFDVFQSMSDDPLKTCPTCGKDLRRKISKGTGIIFKGSGFYKNDNRKPDGKEGSYHKDHSQDESLPKSESQASGPPSSPAVPAAAPSSSTSEAPKKEAT